MSVDRESRLDRLLTLARQAGTEASPLEEGFENRLLARIREDRKRKAAWSSWAWRLAPVFFMIVVFLGALEYTAPPFSPPGLYTVVAGVVDGEQFTHLWTGD
jgi:hypothetical protein